MVARELDLPTILGGKQGKKENQGIPGKGKSDPFLSIPHVFPDTPATHSNSVISFLEPLQRGSE